MSSKILYLYDNLLDSATLTASSELAGFPANNLKNPFRSKVWRTEGANPGVATLVIDHGSAKTVDAIALTGYTWATAPGRLVVEFNDSNSWDTPAAVETLTWHSPTTPGGNKGSIILKLSTARTYRYNRLRVAAQSVTLTAASSGSTGIYTADSDHIDFGTGDFTLVWRGSLPDWTPASAVRFMHKVTTLGGGVTWDGFRFDYQVSGKLGLFLYRADAGTLFESTVASGLADGTTHEICISVVRETASVAGSVTFYVDGVILGASVAITAAATASISSTASLYFSGWHSARAASTSEFFATFNRALSAADVLSLYRNGIAYEDKWGSQTSITSGTLTTGKKYRINTYNADDDFTNIGAASNAAGVEFTATGTTPTHWAHSSSLVQIGATMALEPEGIKTADWQDSSNNNCDGAYPAAGCTVNGAADWDLGRLFLGEYFEPTHNYSWGYEEGIADPSLISSTIGGQDHADEIEHYRTVMASGVMSAQSQWVDYQVMVNTVGVRKPLWIAFDYDSEAEERTIYGKFTTPPAITRPYLFNWNFELKEDR